MNLVSGGDDGDVDDHDDGVDNDVGSAQNGGKLEVPEKNRKLFFKNSSAEILRTSFSKQY